MQLISSSVAIFQQRASEIFDLNLSDDEDGGGENQDYPSPDGTDDNDSLTDEDEKQSSEPTSPIEQPVSVTKGKDINQKSSKLTLPFVFYCR